MGFNCNDSSDGVRHALDSLYIRNNLIDIKIIF